MKFFQGDRCNATLGGDRLALSPDSFGLFDWIIIPPNHFHMKGLTRSPELQTEKEMAELFVQRLEELVQLPLPWRKIGIAHLNCSLTFSEGDYLKVLEWMDEDRLAAVFARLAHLQAGIEINTSCFPEGWQAQEEAQLRLLKIARDQGCRFYVGSDAHSPEEMRCMQQRARQVADQLELTEEQRFRVL